MVSPIIIPLIMTLIIALTPIIIIMSPFIALIIMSLIIALIIL